MDIQIRKAVKNELPLIQQMAWDIWPKTYAPILSAAQVDYMLDLFYSNESLQKDFEKENYYFFIININASDSGYAGIEKTNEQTWHLHKIYLYLKYRGKGLGKKLIAHLEAFAVQNGAACLTLNVNRYNKAVDFYKSQGYEIVKQEDINIGNGFFMNDYVMRKTLKTLEI